MLRLRIRNIYVMYFRIKYVRGYFVILNNYNNVRKLVYYNL